MTLLEFKDAVALPLKQTIDQYRTPTLAQFASRDDLTKQWDRAEGMMIALNHIESTYAQKVNAQGELVQEILPPQ